MKCPIGSVERRLSDAFHHWRQLEERYFDPERFRMSLNSFLQETRNVTFIMQKVGKRLPLFKDWYEGWRAKMSSDPILRWSVDSRNRITKEGDLEIESRCLIRFTSGWLDETVREFPVNPLSSQAAILWYVLGQIPKELISEESLLCYERRWVDSRLPQTELLQAASHILLSLSDLVRDAHEQLSFADDCGFPTQFAKYRKDYPFELIELDDYRKVWVQVDTPATIKYDVTHSTFSRSDSLEEVHLRYGDLKASGRSSRSLGSLVAFYDAISRKMLAKDGFLGTFLHAVNLDSKSASVQELRMRNRADKHVAIRRAALSLEKRGFAWAILTGEAWVGNAPNSIPWRHASDDPNRQEALTVTGVSASGEFWNKSVIFHRTKEGIVFGDETENQQCANIMMPILAALRR